jgi:hypothetical protein
MHKSLARIVALIVLAATLLLIVGAVAAAPTAPPVPVWQQDFSVDSAGWTDNSIAPGYGQISVAGGVATMSGFGGSAPFSRFDKYRGVWPGTWTAEIDVYLDPAWPAGVGFNYTVASSNATGGHRRDFIFHVGTVENYGPITTKSLLVNGSNNSDPYANPWKLTNENGGNFYVIPAAGWYTLQHVFSDVGGVLSVDLNLLDAGNTEVWTITRSDPTDLIPSVVGGNRYAWFTFIDVPGGIQVDNHELFVTPTTVDATTTNAQACGETTVDIAINDAIGLYGYEFQVTYDPALVDATAVINQSWFDGADGPPGWQGDCLNGVCKFASNRERPDLPQTGSGNVATVTLTSKGTSAGNFNLGVTGVVLSDIDGYALPAAASADIPIEVCAAATVSGKVSLQGRPWTPGIGISGTGQGFVVNLVGPYGTYTVEPNLFDGTFSFSNVPFGVGGSDYTIDADHFLYLKHGKTLLSVNGPLANQNTRLLGGDANNSGEVEIGDATCIGNNFNLASPWVCTGGSPDINADAKVNIQDLSIMGGNYGLSDTQPW